MFVFQTQNASTISRTIDHRARDMAKKDGCSKQTACKYNQYAKIVSKIVFVSPVKCHSFHHFRFLLAYANGKAVYTALTSVYALLAQKLQRLIQSKKDVKRERNGTEQ